MKRVAPVTYLLPFLALLPITRISADEVYSKTEAANRLYKQGRYEEALKLYEDALLLSPADPKLKMNKGSALYQLGDFDNAEKNYEGALSAKEKKERATAHYNMGNILFRKGEMLQRQGDMKAQERYKGALDHYTQTLNLQPSDFDAKWNLQLAYQRIKQMEQQKQQQQDNKDKKDKNNQQKQNQQQQQNDQKQQDQQQKDEQQQDQQQQQQNQQDKKEQQQPQQEQDKEDMKKEEAARLIELYADDADSLNKPPKKGVGKQQQPERDW
jgi:Ca-activated chloride channel family protein